MICDNCEAIIDDKEEYCPNCGMQLLDLPPASKKRKDYKNPESLGSKNSPLIEKPLQKKYMEYSDPESPDHSQYNEEYVDEEEYYGEETHQNEVQKEYKESSGSGMVNIILFLFIALIIGFIVGLLIFGSSQSIPSIPGF